MTTNAHGISRKIRFPQIIEAGLLVEKIGNGSITYRVGLFLEEDPEPAASGHFVDVYVDHETRRPIRVPEIIREALSPILINA